MFLELMRIGRENKKGQALFMVLSMLVILFIVGVTMFYLAYSERTQAVTFLANTRAQYVAEAGIVYAKKVLAKDRGDNAVDSLGDEQFALFKGEDFDVDNDGVKESRWVSLPDSAGDEFGRFSVLVCDEAAKVNINAASGQKLADRKGSDVYDISLGEMLNGISYSYSLAESMVSRRYGEDTAPGEKGVDDNKNTRLLEKNFIDDDSDGDLDEQGEGVDEHAEFDPFSPYGDDTPWITADEIARIVKNKTDLSKILRYVTVYSRDYEIDCRGLRRLSLNGAAARDVLDVFLKSGVTDAYRHAAGFIDAIDIDVFQTTLDKYAFKSPPGSLVSAGGWQPSGGAYQAQPGSEAGVFRWENLPVDDGEYYCALYSSFPSGRVGDVIYSEKEIEEGLVHGSGFTRKVAVSGGSFELKIRPDKNAVSSLSSAEISLTQAAQGLAHTQVYGTEAVVINEIMASLSKQYSVSAQDLPGGAWVWDGTGFKNASPKGGALGEGKWVFNGIKKGYYYLQLLGGTGPLIGDVSCAGTTEENVVSGEYWPATVYIGSDGLLNIGIQNNTLNDVVYFGGLILSQEPDGEYIELLNLSGQEIDLSHFMVEVYDANSQLLVGYPAEIPANTGIAGRGYLVLAIDADDASCDGLEGNNISFKSLWGKDAVGLIFSKKIAAGYDMLPNAGGYAALRSPAYEAVDYVRYQAANSLVSFERSDPAVYTDNDNDGKFDGWFVSQGAAGGTPGEENDNSDMYDIDPLTMVVYKHSLDEVSVFNHRVMNISGFRELSSGIRWQKNSINDLARIADKFSSVSLYYPLSGNFVEGNWKNEGDIFSPEQAGARGLWKWKKVPVGTYDVNILAAGMGSPGTIKVGVKVGGGNFEYSADIHTNRGTIYYGRVTIEEPSSMELELTGNSSQLLYFSHLLLEPAYEVLGRINVNTAPREVLSALPLPGSIIDNIISYRPFGDNDVKLLGTGDLLAGSTLGPTDEEKTDNFGLIANLITVKSNVYRITSRGESLKKGQPSGGQSITAVVER